MRDVMKHLGSVHDGDSLEDLIGLSTCGHTVEIREGLVWLDNRDVTGAWIVFVEGERDFRNPDKCRMTERQAEELVWNLHNN